MIDKRDEIVFRQAQKSDLADIVRMLADDKLGAQRESHEDPLPQSYLAAFERICDAPDNMLVIAELGGSRVGMMQLTFIPSISFRGGTRLLIESVRVDGPFRGRGLGEVMFEWAIDQARVRNCVMVQLTTNSARPDALRFYERLGFVSSHVGLKLYLDQSHSPH